jgi:hypothetical protein
MLVFVLRSLIGRRPLGRSGLGRAHGRRRRRGGRCRRLRAGFAAVLGGFGPRQQSEQHGAGGGGEGGGLAGGDMTCALGLVRTAGVVVGCGHGHLLLVSVRGTRR